MELPVLEIKDISKHFGGVKAVNGCSFDIQEGSITALIGPNGAGKTTVFNLVSGLDQPHSGEILYKGREIHGLSPHQIARLGVARTFQMIKLFPTLTALDNLILSQPLIGDRLSNIFLRPKQVREDEDHHTERARELLALVGLEGKANELANELSYGQQKLLEIARSLGQEADFILLDEPAAGVNPKMEEIISETLLKLKKMGKTILLIEHDMPFVMGIADRVIVMAEGTVIADGPPKKIKNDPKVIQAYLGDTAF